MKNTMVLLGSAITVVLLPVLNHAQLADGPWPMFRHDACTQGRVSIKAHAQELSCGVMKPEAGCSLLLP